MITYIASLKFILKNFVAYSLYYTGILFIIKNYKLKNKTVVLTYHRVLPDDDFANSFSNPGIVVKPETFARNLKFLKKHFNVISSIDIKSTLQPASDNNKKKCVITFDDGWIDNYLYALPIIREFNLPVTLFLPIDYIGTGQLFWQEQIGRILYQLYQTEMEPCNEVLDELQITTIRDSSPSQVRENILKVVSQLKQKPYPELEKIIQKLQAAVDTSKYEHIDRYIEWEQARKMQAHGLYLGSHACSHRILTRLDTDTISKELQLSAETIEQYTGLKPLVIAYPNGDSNEAVQRAAFDAGYEIGFTTQPGYVSSSDNALELKRINLHEKKAANSPLLMMSILGYI